jgi:GDP/UDP-N,N'-diacetylbacillosamine 2-epimerase (hydrolysing)
MARTLLLAQQSGKLEISVCVTGMHLSPVFGNTVKEIVTSGLHICGKVPVELDGTTGVVMARALGHELIGIADVLAREQPDIVMVLGDRGEMLAGALAAIHLNIPIVHVHGGERSGTVDEPVRHAISKLAHYHLVTTEGARERLVRMGEKPEHVFVTGAPGLDGLQELPVRSRDDLCRQWRFDPDRPVALVVFHAVLQEQSEVGEQMDNIVHAVLSERVQALCLMPNADAGGSLIRQALESHARHPDVRSVTHLAREDYISWMRVADVMVGNSSSGIIEAASLRLPVVNVGSRQSGRERGGNVVDVPSVKADIAAAVRKALHGPRGPWPNVYGDGHAGERIVALLASLPLSPELMYKSNAY